MTERVLLSSASQIFLLSSWFVLKQLERYRVVTFSMCSWNSLSQYLVRARMRLWRSSHSHSFSTQKPQQQMSWMASSSRRVNFSCHYCYRMLQMYCFLRLGLVIISISSQSYSMEVKLPPNSLPSHIQQLQSWSSLMRMLQLLREGSTQAIRSSESICPCQSFSRALTRRQPLIWMVLQLGTHLCSKQNISFHIPYPFIWSAFSRLLSSNTLLCSLLKSYFMGSAFADFMYSQQFYALWLSRGWHSQGSRYTHFQKPASHSEQCWICFRNSMNDSLKLRPLSYTQMRGLLTTIVSYCSMVYCATTLMSPLILSNLILGERYSPSEQVPLIMAGQLKNPPSWASTSVYFWFNSSYQDLLMSRDIWMSSGVISSNWCSYRRLRILRQQPLLQLGSRKIATSDSVRQDWYSLSSNRHAAAFEYRTDRWRLSSSQRFASAISYKLIAYRYFLALKQLLACYLSSSEVFLMVVSNLFKGNTFLCDTKMIGSCPRSCYWAVMRTGTKGSINLM